MQLVRINHRKLHHPEAVDFNKRIINRFVATAPLAAPVAAALAAFTEGTARIDALVEKARGSRFTDDVQTADALRDRYVQALFDLCTGFSQCEHPGRAAAGALLLEAYQAYGSSADLARAGYGKQTTLVDNLVRDLRARPDLVEALQLLSLGSLLDALSAANGQFRALQEDRSTDEMQKADSYELVMLRRENAKAYTELMKQLESAYHFTGGAEPWLGIVAAVSQVAEEYHLTIARRAGVAATKAAPAVS